MHSFISAKLAIIFMNSLNRSIRLNKGSEHQLFCFTANTVLSRVDKPSRGGGGEALPIMNYVARLRPKGIPFSIRLEVYKRVGISLVKV